MRILIRMATMTKIKILNKMAWTRINMTLLILEITKMAKRVVKLS